MELFLRTAFFDEKYMIKHDKGNKKIYNFKRKQKKIF